MARTKKVFTEKCCKICEMITTDIDEMNKFHGRYCRLCFNKSCYEKNLARREDYKEFRIAYNKAWNRQSYRQKIEALGREVRKTCHDQTLPRDIKVKDFKVASC